MIFFISILDLSGQSERIERVDSLLTEMTANDLFSGSVLIADGPNILLSKGYGYSDRENKIKNTPDTRFDLSSGSKIFTGTALVYLAQQGKVSFSDTIGKYFPGLPKGNVITIHQILTHSSGLDNFYKARGFSYKDIKNCTDIIPYMKTLPLVYEPGDSCIYSTGNPIVIGAVIEKITGMDFRDYIGQLFVDPLDLNNTCFAKYWELDESQRQYAIGYRKNDTGEYTRNDYDYDYGFIPLSAGGAWSSVNDLFKFDLAVFSGNIINDEYLKIMTAKYTPQWGDCYFGYFWINDLTHQCIGHAGTSSGWNTWNYYYPETKYTIIILTNFGSVKIFELSKNIELILFE